MKFSLEIDFPLKKIWDFCYNPSNVPKWMDEFESCHCDGEVKLGSKIKAQFKNKNAFVPILIIEFQPYKQCKSVMKVPFFTQETECFMEEISSQKDENF
jgi:hypothetical protein